MRGLWDNEQPLTPALLKSALALAAGFLAALAAVNVVDAVMSLLDHDYVAAMSQLSSGIAYPFAVWLGLRILMDILTLQHRSRDKLEELTEAPRAQAGISTTHVKSRVGRASDDGPAYPED